MNWNKYRRNDKTFSQNATIDLVVAFEDEHKGEILENKNKAIKYLKLIENYRLIRSTQVASVALANADLLLINN